MASSLAHWSRIVSLVQLAKKGARCDYGIFMGASATNYEEIVELSSQVIALKMYLNETFTTLRLDGVQQWLKHFDHWPKEVPICAHAEGRTTAAIILLASLSNRSVHICHVATKEEIEIIKAAKLKASTTYGRRSFSACRPYFSFF